MNNIKYNIDKETGKLVAVPGMDRPDFEKFLDFPPEGIVEKYNKYVDEYNAHIAELPQPIQISPEFAAYSETKPGPYEKDIHFKVVQQMTKHTAFPGVDVAYPIQKAEPRKSDELKSKILLGLREGVNLKRSPSEKRTDEEILDRINDRAATIAAAIAQRHYAQPAEPAPLPDNWNEWVKHEAKNKTNELVKVFSFMPGNERDWAIKESIYRYLLNMSSAVLEYLHQLRGRNLSDLKQLPDDLRIYALEEIIVNLEKKDEEKEAVLNKLLPEIDNKDKEISRLKQKIENVLTYMAENNDTITTNAAAVKRMLTK